MRAALADPAVRAKISAANRSAWARRRGWEIPPEYAELYSKLRRKVGVQEAVRMLKDEQQRTRERLG